MSGFDSLQFAEEPIQISAGIPQEFVVTFNSFDPSTKYLVFVDGLAKCPWVLGSLQFDILINGKNMISSRMIQTATDIGTTPLSINWPVVCSDCTIVQHEDGSMDYVNEILLRFTWHQSDNDTTTTTSTITTTTPSVQSISVSVLAVA